MLKCQIQRRIQAKNMCADFAIGLVVEEFETILIYCETAQIDALFRIDLDLLCHTRDEICLIRDGLIGLLIGVLLIVIRRTAPQRDSDEERERHFSQ